MSNNDIHLELTWVAGSDTGKTVDPRLFSLLQIIKETGTLSAATAQVGLHYRQSWGLITKWSGILGQPLVVMERGKGTRLSPLGEKLVWIQKRITGRLSPHLESAASEVEDELGELLSQERVALHVYASHDLALADLRDFFRGQSSGPTLDLRFVGSLDSVVALCKARCEIAGFHVPEGPLAQRVARSYLPWLKPRAQRLIRFIRRTQGLIVNPANTLKIGSVEDIVNNNARFLNRQRGSGTRLAFDQMLQEQGIEKTQVNGYYSEEFTHLAVAAAVAGGVADVGLGLEAAARKLQMGFVPLFTETYYLLTKRESLEQKHVEELISVLQSPAFQTIVGKFAGYDAADAGSVLTISDAIPGLAAEDGAAGQGRAGVARGS
jgi:molybdate transport repressor ModE-like protein